MMDPGIPSSFFFPDHHRLYIGANLVDMARADSSNDVFRSLRHHDEYYLTGGDLYFLVEQYLFRVHKYFFERESLFFKKELATPASPGETRRGSSEGNAILLKDVNHREFARFLWVFYNPRYSIYDADWEDWTDILKLAQRWSFPEVKDLAIRELENLDMPDVERVHFYQEYSVDRRLLIARYAALTERADPLSFEEGLRLGIATSLMIARARECVRSPVQAGIRSPISPSIDTDEMTVIIKDLFNISDGPAYTPIEQFRPNPFVKASGGLTASRRTGPRQHQSMGQLSALGAAPTSATARHYPPPPQPLATPRTAQETRPPTPPLSPETEQTTTTPRLDGSPTTPRLTDEAHLPSTEGVEQVGLGEEKTAESMVGEGADEISLHVHESKLPETPNTNEASVEQESPDGGKIDAEQEEVKQDDHVTEGMASGITDEPQEILTSEEVAPATTPVIVSPSSAGASDDPWADEANVPPPGDTATTPVVASPPGAGDDPWDFDDDVEGDADVPPENGARPTTPSQDTPTVADDMAQTETALPAPVAAPDENPTPDATLAEAAVTVKQVSDVATADDVVAPKDALPSPPSSDANAATNEEPGLPGDVADAGKPDVDLSKIDEVPPLSSPAAAQAPPPVGTSQPREPDVSSTGAGEASATTLHESGSTATGQPAQVSAPAEVKKGEDDKQADKGIGQTGKDDERTGKDNERTGKDDERTGKDDERAEPPRTRKTSENIPSATPLGPATPARSTSVSEPRPSPWPAPPSPELRRAGTGSEDGAQRLQPGGDVRNAFTNARSPQAGEQPLEMPGGMGPRSHGASYPLVTNPYTNVTSPRGGSQPLDNNLSGSRSSTFSSPLKAHSPAFVPRQQAAPTPPPPPQKKSSWFSGVFSAVSAVVSPAQTSPPPMNRSPAPARGQHFEHQQYSPGPHYPHKPPPPPPPPSFAQRQTSPEPAHSKPAASHSTATTSVPPNPPDADSKPAPAPSTDAPIGGEAGKPELSVDTDMMWPDGTKGRFVPSATPSSQTQTAGGSGAESGVEALPEIKEDEAKGVKQDEPVVPVQVERDAGDKVDSSAGEQAETNAGEQTEQKAAVEVDEQGAVDPGTQSETPEAAQTLPDDKTPEGDQVEMPEPVKDDAPAEPEVDAPAKPAAQDIEETANAEGQPQTDAVVVDPETDKKSSDEPNATVDTEGVADPSQVDGAQQETQDASATATKPELEQGQDTSASAGLPEEQKPTDVEEQQTVADSAPPTDDKAQLEENASKADDANANTSGDQAETQLPQETDGTAGPVESDAQHPEKPDETSTTELSGDQPTPSTPQVDDEAEFAGMSKTQVKKLKKKRREEEEKRLKEESEKKEEGEEGDEATKREEEEENEKKRKEEEEAANAKAKEEEEKAAKAKEAQSKADSEAAKKTTEKAKPPTAPPPQLSKSQKKKANKRR